MTRRNYWCPVRARLRALAENPACPARAGLQELVDAPDAEILDDVSSLRGDLILLACRLGEMCGEAAPALTLDAVRAGQDQIRREHTAQSERLRRIEACQDSLGDEYSRRACDVLQQALADELIDGDDVAFVERVLTVPGRDLSVIEIARVNQIMRRAQVRRQSN